MAKVHWPFCGVALAAPRNTAECGQPVPSEQLTTIPGRVTCRRCLKMQGVQLALRDAALNAARLSVERTTDGDAP